MPRPILEESPDAFPPTHPCSGGGWIEREPIRRSTDTPTVNPLDTVPDTMPFDILTEYRFPSIARRAR